MLECENLLAFNYFSGFGSDPKTSKYELHARIPRLEMIAKYKIDGKVLILPIRGAGASNLTLGKLWTFVHKVTKLFFFLSIRKRRRQTQIQTNSHSKGRRQKIRQYS